MKIQKTETKVIFNINIEKTIWQNEILKERKLAAKKIKIPGYRPGKVPEEIALKNIKAESVLIDAANKLINSTIKNLDQQEEYKAIDLEVYPTPSVEIGKNFSVDELSFDISYWMIPKVTIDNYKSLKVELVTPTVDDKEVEAEINQILEKEKMLSDKKGDVIEKGDLVNFDFHGFIDGIEFPGGKAEKYDLEIGSNQFIPGFEEQMIGVKKGEQKDVTVTFPKDYHAKEMAGKKAVFKIKVHNIKTVSKPTLNEAIIKELKLPDQTIKTPEQFKVFLKENILNYKKQQTNEQNLTQINAAIVKDAKYGEIPQVMIDDEKKEVAEQFLRKLKELNMDKPSFMKMAGYDEKSFDAQMEESAKTNIIVFSAIDHIIKEEKIIVTDAEIEERYTLLSKAHGRPVEEIKKYIDFETIKDALLHEKALLKLIEWNSKPVKK